MNVRASQASVSALQAQIGPMDFIKGKTAEKIRMVKKEGATLEQMEDLQKDLIRIEKIRHTKALKMSGDRLAQSDREIAKMQEEGRTLQKLIDKEKQRQKGGVGQAFAGAEHKFAGAGEDIMGGLDKDLAEAGQGAEGKMKGTMKAYWEGLKKAKGAGKDFRDDVGKSGKKIGGFAGKIPIFGKALAKGGLAFRSFGIMGKVAIRGLVTAIPVIGQLLFVVDIMIGVLKKAFSWMMKFGGGASEASKKQEMFNQQLDNYKEVQKAANDESQTASETIISQGTATKGLLDAMDDARAATNKQNKEANIFGKIWIHYLNGLKREWEYIRVFFNNWDDWLVRLGAKFKKWALGVKKDNAIWLNPLIRVFNWLLAEGDESMKIDLIDESEIQGQINTMDKAIDSISDKMVRSTKLATLDLIPRTMTMEFKTLERMIQGSGRESDELAKFLGTDNINTWVETVDKVTKGGSLDLLEGGVKGIVEELGLFQDESKRASDMQVLFSETMRRGTATTTDESAALQAFKSAISEGAEKTDAFVASFSKASKFSDTLKTFNQLEGTLKRLGEGADETAGKAIFDEFAAAGPGLKALIGYEQEIAKVTADATLEWEMFGHALEGITKEEYIQQRIETGATQNLSDNVKLVKQRLKDSVEHELSSKRRLAVNKELIKRTKLGGKLNAKALKEEIRLNNENLKIKKTSVENDMYILNLKLKGKIKEKMTAEDLEKLTDKEREDYQALLNLRQQHLDLGFQQVGTEEQKLQIRKIELELHQKQVKAGLEQAKTAVQLFKLESKMADIRKGFKAELSPAEELSAKVSMAEIAVTTAEAELEMAVLRLEIEKDMFRLKHTEDGVLKEGAQAVLDNMDEVHKINILNTREKIKQSRIALQGAKIGGMGSMGLPTEGAGEMRSMQRHQQEVSEHAALSVMLYRQVLAERLDTAETNRILAQHDLWLEETETILNAKEILKKEAHLAEMVRIEAETNAANEASKKLTSRENIALMAAEVSPMLEELRKLGPQGEAVATATEGILVIADSYKAFTDPKATGLDKLQAVGSAIGAIGAIAAAASKARIAGIDKEIEAEKKRDGKSKESLAKIKAMEAKKEKMKKKAFETDKKMKIASTIINTITAAMGAYASLAGTGPQGPILAAVVAGMITALGAAQIAIIAGTSYQGGGSLGGGSGPTAVNVGERGNKVDIAKTGNQAGELSYLRGERGVGRGSGDYTPGGFAGRKYRAAGGPIIVGEQGPELFAPKVPGEIIANQAGGAPLSVNFQVNAIDSSNMQDMLTTQRGSIIDMIREAANSHGENFLEAVDTSGYGSEDTGDSYEPASGIGGSM